MPGNGGWVGQEQTVTNEKEYQKFPQRTYTAIHYHPWNIIQKRQVNETELKRTPSRLPPVQTDELRSASHCKSIFVVAATADLSPGGKRDNTLSTTGPHHLVRRRYKVSGLYKQWSEHQENLEIHEAIVLPEHYISVACSSNFRVEECTQPVVKKISQIQNKINRDNKLICTGNSQI